MSAQLSMQQTQRQMLSKEPLLLQQICKPAPHSSNWCDGMDFYVSVMLSAHQTVT